MRNTNDLLPLKHLDRYGKVYPSAWKLASDFRRDWEVMPHFRKWCYLPVAGAAAIVKGEAERQGVDYRTAVADVGNLGALIAWRQTKGIYRFDPTMFDALWTTPLDGDLPIELLYKMPEWCVWIETPNTPESPGFFAYLEYDLKNGRTELRISISSQVGLFTQPIHLTRENLTDCIEEAYQEGIRQGVKHGDPVEPDAVGLGRTIANALKTVIAPRVSLLLYLCTVNSEVRDAKGSSRKPHNPAPRKTRHGNKLFPADNPATWDVAVRMGAAIRAAEHEQRTSKGGAHARPKAHVRRAHWATYWTGPKSGEQKPLLRWLPPIPINKSEQDLPATLREID